ncbi:MAG TPA: hypothetical protein VMI54_22445 [Polyangiaceae bacterium]|nr:hypothetical protein [Polyangiaceae bacterium]
MKAFARRHALRAGLVFALALLSTRAVLRATGGVPAVPLDDAFIHFEYARSFWEGRGFAFTAGAAPVPGATSLLWPALLTLPYGFGLRAERIIWAAWAFGWLSLGMLGYETHRAGRRLLSDDGALAAEIMVLTFGGHVWFAASGMEVLPLAWILMRTVRVAAEWLETPSAERRFPRELVVLGALAPFIRPEGLVATLSVAATLGFGLRGRERAFGVLMLVLARLPALVNRVFTGSSLPTTAMVKWLPLSPYHASFGKLSHAVLTNVGVFFGTLLNGEVWSAVFLPQGSALVFWPALPVLVWLGFRRGVPARALLVAAVAAGMLIPTTYDSFLWNRLRYLWPFAAAWFVGIAAVTDAFGMLVARYAPGYERVRLLASGIVVGGFVSHLGWSIDDLATSANAIRAQQASLGHWAQQALPEDAVIGVNDTGAIGYFSERRVFDVVGLTTRGEARYWVAGAGSRFEHYERLGARALPTEFIVYPEWFALPGLLGEYRTSRRVAGATILGGETMVAYDADYTLLGSGSRPLERHPDDGLLIDEIDVADLESEAAHAYDLDDALAAFDVALEDAGAMDGARRERRLDAFDCELAPGGTLVLRVSSEGESELSVTAGGSALGRVTVEPGAWRELTVAIPADSPRARARVEVRAHGARFTSLHYWSYARAAAT